MTPLKPELQRQLGEPMMTPVKPELQGRRTARPVVAQLHHEGLQATHREADADLRGSPLPAARTLCRGRRARRLCARHPVMAGNVAVAQIMMPQGKQQLQVRQPNGRMAHHLAPLRLRRGRAR